MCGIAGMCDFTGNYLGRKHSAKAVLDTMKATLRRRGPDEEGTYIGPYVGLAHGRLAVIDPEGGKQPMARIVGGYEYAITYNGELYNTEKIRNRLKKKGYEFSTASDTEVVLLAYVEYGRGCVEQFNGIFAFAIWDSYHRGLFLCRDRFGVKPLFYMEKGAGLIFGSEIKTLLAYPQTKAVIDKNGLCELFGLGPARSPGCGVFQGIKEIPPGYMLYMDSTGYGVDCYFRLEAEEHLESYEDTVAHTRALLFDAIHGQLVSDVPLCTLLSGGLDSSIVTAVAAQELKLKGIILDTYSFDYTENSKYFTGSSFQPDEDRPYVDLCVKELGTNHTYLECSPKELVENLFLAVDAKDLPGMADVDSSLLQFAKEMKKNHTVSLSGECADEIFGGYPWFQDKTLIRDEVFPWSKNLEFRKEIIARDILPGLGIEEYVKNCYDETMKNVRILQGESESRIGERKMSYLNTAWFMTTLLDRKDRMTMYSGLEVRVPFADHRLVQYLYNVPWEYKYHNNQVKGLLKDAAGLMLPREILERKKCPYPKTYHPEYGNQVSELMGTILRSKDEPILELVNREALLHLTEEKAGFGRPWFGQLMEVPQLFAYIIQMNYWLKKYNITIRR